MSPRRARLLAIWLSGGLVGALAGCSSESAAAAGATPKPDAAPADAACPGDAAADGDPNPCEFTCPHDPPSAGSPCVDAFGPPHCLYELACDGSLAQLAATCVAGSWAVDDPGCAPDAGGD